MTKENHIVLTTINYPLVLETLWNNFSRFGRLDMCHVWVVADRKTPPESAMLCRTMTEKGMETTYLDIAAQDAWGSSGIYNSFYKRIPYNNETRRNIGYLHALENGCKRLIYIDDDNFPVDDDDFIGGHGDVGSGWDGDVISTETGFYNLCEHIRIEPSRAIFPRGFPFLLRGIDQHPRLAAAPKNALIGARAGLWLHDPDVDATTWLNGKIFGVDYTGPATGVMAQDTWSPINTQNTCVARDLVPAFLCVPMGWDVPGGKLQRYGDIWGGYLLQAMMKQTRYHVAFGRPVVEHRRNSHVYIDDLRAEYWGMILTDWLIELLKNEFLPQRNDIIDRVHEMSHFVTGKMILRLPKWCPPEIEGFFGWMAENLNTWGDACKLAMSRG